MRLLLIVFGLLALVGVSLTFLAAVGGSENLLLSLMKDDGFYYLQLAKNIAQGHGATFDRIAPTNGFHPLWALLLAPVFWIQHGSPYTPVRLAILLALAVHLAAAWAVRRAASRWTDPSTGLLAGFFYAANPLALYLVVSGMESPLLALLVALLVAESIAIQKGDATIADRAVMARIGILSGFCILARTDAVLLVAIVLAAAVFLAPAPPAAPATSVGMRCRGALRAGLSAIAILSPWLLWNLSRFGTLVQVSARAHNLHAVSSRAPGAPEGIERFLKVGSSLAGGVFNTISGRTGLPKAAIAGGLVAVGALLAWWIVSLLADREDRRDLGERIRWFAAPLLYAAAFLAAAFFFLGHIRSWYIAGPLVVGSILWALPAYYALRKRAPRARGRLASALVAAGIAVGMLPLGFVFTNEFVYNAKAIQCWKEASDWVASHVEPGERVASFNSGTFGYLSPRTVVNLDCVVNNRAISWLEQGRLIPYLREYRIRVVIDDPGYARRYFGAYGGADWRDGVAEIDTLVSGLVVYAVKAAD